MTLTALVVAGTLIVIGVGRVDRRDYRRSLIYWWTLSTFGLGTVNLLLGAAGVVEAPNETIGTLFVLPSIAITLTLVIRAAVHKGSLSTGGLLCIAPVVISLAFTLGGYSFVTPLLSLMSFSVAVVLPAVPYPIDDVLDGLVASARFTAVTLLVLAAAGTPGLIGQCRLDKCSLWGQQIGGGGTANGFGVAIAVIGVIATLRLSVPRFLAVLVGTALLVDLASSRSALYIMGCGLVAVCIERWFRGVVLTIGRTAALLAAVVIVAVVGLRHWDPAAFTDRAKLWYQARAMIEQRPLLGWGTSFWVRQPPTTLVEANYSTHNLLLELLVSFGFLGLLLVIAGVLAVRRLIRPESAAHWHIAMMCWIAGGTIEVISAPGRPYLLEATSILPLLLAGCAATASPRPRRRNAGRTLADRLLHRPIVTRTTPDDVPRTEGHFAVTAAMADLSAATAGFGKWSERHRPK